MTSSESSSGTSSGTSSASSSETNSGSEKPKDRRKARQKQSTNEDGADRSGMPKNESKPDQCPVPFCKASNRAVKNHRGRYEDTDVAHRFLLHCPKIQEMTIKERREYYRKAGCTCKRCFSTQHNFQNCPMQLKHPKFCKEKLANGKECQGAHHWLLHFDSHI